MRRLFLCCWVMLTLVAAHCLAGATTYPIVDTGQVRCYNANAEMTAPASGQPLYGQDGQVQGRQPLYQDNGDGTVTDRVTGLSWVKARGQKMTWGAAAAGAAACRVGGYSDWRMPTIKELYSLIVFTGRSGLTVAESMPYLDPVFGFAYGNTALGERLIDCQDWSATAYVSTTMNGMATIFGVNFADGRIKGYPYLKPGTQEPNSLYIRYVRGNPAYGINTFVNNLDDTISDTATGLMWTRTDSGTGMNWAQALAWVQAKNAANYLGHNDWRLPNAKELQSIVDYTRSPATTQSAALNPLFAYTAITNEGNAADAPFYWTGTTHLDNMGAVYVAFGRALGWMQSPPDSGTYVLQDVHGAGAQRSDPKEGSAADYPNGKGPQGDVIRINNYVRLVRTLEAAPSNMQPDLHIRNGGTDNPFTGDNIYHMLVPEQRREQVSVIGVSPAYYVVKIQNDGNAADTFTLIGPATEPGWVIRYMDAANNDRTEEVTGELGTEIQLEPGASVEWVVIVKADAMTSQPVFHLAFTAFSKTDPNKADYVVMDTRAKWKGQPDLLARTKAENLYSFDNVFGTDGANQIKRQDVGNGTYAAYYVALQNDGGLPDTYVLRMPLVPKGWKATVYDTANWADITAQLTAPDGLTTGTVNPGAMIQLYLAVAPDAAAPGASTCHLPLNAVSKNDATKLDAVQLITGVVARAGVDVLARTKAETAFSFDNIYGGTDGLNQIKRMEVVNGAYAAYYVAVQNEGNTEGTFVVKAPPVAKGWKVLYYNTANWADITAQITGAEGWTTDPLPGGAMQQLYIAVAPDATIPGAVECPLTVVALAKNDATKLDAVRLVTNVILRRNVDLLAKTKTETVFSFDNVYGLDGFNQTKRLEVPNGAYAAYYVGIQNEGNAEDNFVVKAPLTPKGWKALYYNTNTPTWTDITAQITSTDGYLTGMIPGGAMLTLYVAIAPDSTVVGQAEFVATIGARSQTDTIRYDVVRLVTFVIARRSVDLLAKTKLETTYSFDNVYSLDGLNQIKRQTVDAGVYAAYYVGVQNEGNAPDTFVVKARPAPRGWKAIIYDTSTPTWTDITAAITGAEGWSTGEVTSLKTLYIVVKPEAGGDPNFVMPITAAAVSDTAKNDTVQLVTSLAVKLQPDMLVKLKTETTPLGGNIYNTSCEGQKRDTTVATGVYTAFYALVQNDGNVADTFNLRALAIPKGWKVTYYSPSFADITAAITSVDGWMTAPLAPGATLSFYVAVSPTAEAAGGSACVLTLGATSQGDPTKKDAVQMITNVVQKSQADVLIRSKTENAYFGDNLYSADGATQLRTQAAVTNEFALYYVAVQNDGNAAADMTVKATVDGTGWKVVIYNTATWEDVTAKIAAGMTLPAVAPGAMVQFYVAVKPIAPAGNCTVTFAAAPGTDTAKADVAKLTTTKPQDVILQ